MSPLFNMNARQAARTAPPDAGAATDPHAQVVLTGEVSYIVFSSVESGFRVLRVKLDQSCGGKNTVVAGRSSSVRVGDRIRAVGRWKQSKYGLQLDAESIAALDAVTVDGLGRSLDGLVSGLGPIRARRLVDALGGAEKTINVLDQICSSIPRRDPDLIAVRTQTLQARLRKLEALAEGTTFAGERDAALFAREQVKASLRDLDVDADVRRLVEDPATLIGSLDWLPLSVRVDLVLAWRESRVEREVEAQLASLNLPVGLRARLVARYGADAARIVMKEPYRLTTEVEGIGFLTADDIALKTGMAVDSLDRVDAAVLHVLREQADDGGHTVCSTSDLSKAMFTLFMQRRPPAPIVEDGPACVEAAVARLIEKKRVALDPGEAGVSLLDLARAEEEIARGLRRLLVAKRPPLEFAGTIDVRLTDEQQLAVRSVFERGVGVITGGPGCGKTHTCKEIVRVARSLGLHVELCAPTARAAKRLSEMTEDGGAVTIHRLLEAKGLGRFDRNVDNPISADVVLVDECFDYKQPILTENGWEYIGTIVNAKKNVKVWSRNPTTGQLELKKIKRWLKRDMPKSGEMLRITAGRSGEATRRGARVIRCTTDHKILTGDGYRRAGNLRIGDTLVVRGSALTSMQRSVLVGSMLGDGSMTRQRTRNSPQPTLMNGEAQIDYLEFKRTIFGDLAGPLQESKSGYCDRIVWRFTVAATDDSTRLAEEMVFSGKHQSGRRRWSPTNRFLELVDPMALAVWFMDNGSTASSKYACLHTERFSLGDHERFVEWFKDRYGLVAKIRQSSRGYYWLSFGVIESAKLFDLIRAFVPKCMKWKVPGAKDFRPRKERQPETCLAEVKSIQPHRPNPGHRKFVYDIEVADHHNYVAGNVVVSNCSMVDVSLMAALTSAIRPSARLVLVGDHQQLPPVGPGAPFRDVIASGEVPVARLTKIHRQSAGSAIVRVAHGVLRGVAPTPSPDGDRSEGCVHLVRQSNPEEAAKLVVRIVLGLQEELGVDPWEAMVIAPMRKGACGVVALNVALQRAMNPPRHDLPEIEYGKEEGRRTYRRGDRVRQTKNDYERGVVNGDVGRIVEIYPEKGRPRGGPWLDVDFPGAGVVHYDGAQLVNLVLAYCSTVHANQGSEGPAVVLALVDQHYVMLTRTLLYTAITRAKKACIIVGSKRALETAARNARDDARRTTLPKRLKAKIAEGGVP